MSENQGCPTGHASTGSSPTGWWCNDCGAADPGYGCEKCGRINVNEHHLKPNGALCRTYLMRQDGEKEFGVVRQHARDWLIEAGLLFDKEHNPYGHKFYTREEFDAARAALEEST